MWAMKNGQYSWLGGWPIHFTKWGPNEPSMGDGEGCVGVVLNTLWQDESCEHYHSFICKISFGKSLFLFDVCMTRHYLFYLITLG